MKYSPELDCVSPLLITLVRGHLALNYKDSHESFKVCNCLFNTETLGGGLPQIKTMSNFVLEGGQV